MGPQSILQKCTPACNIEFAVNGTDYTTNDQGQVMSYDTDTDDQMEPITKKLKTTKVSQCLYLYSS